MFIGIGLLITLLQKALGDTLLLETGEALLLESGDRLLLEVP